MPEQRRPENEEVDANEVIRNYVESSKSEDEGQQTNMEWYEQASQDTKVPPEAVVTGGDIDAAWDQAAAGEETVGGSSPTPDQDLVDEIGKAVGVGYEDAEPLQPAEKIERRDEQRWELHPASSEDFDERSQSYDTTPAPPNPTPPTQGRSSSAKRGKRKAA
jgi:hypothetical protein